MLEPWILQDVLPTSRTALLAWLYVFSLQQEPHLYATNNFNVPLNAINRVRRQRVETTMLIFSELNAAFFGGETGALDMPLFVSSHFNILLLLLEGDHES